MYTVIKLNNSWKIYNTETGTILRKFTGKATKKEAEEACKLYNKVNGTSK